MIDFSKSARNWMMKPRLFFLIQLLLLVVIFATAFHVEYGHYVDAVREAVRSNNAIADHIAMITQDRHKSIINILQSYATRPLLIDAVKEKDTVTAIGHLATMKKNNPEIDVIFITDRKGILWVSVPVYKETIGRDLSHRDWYKGVSRQWKPYVSGIFESSAQSKNTVVALTVPVFDRKERPIGILSVGQLTLSFGNVVKNFVPDETTKVTIVDQAGNIIYTNQLSYEKKVIRYTFPFSSDMITAYAQIREFMWTVVVQKERSEVLSQLFPHFMKTSITALILYLLIGFMLVFLRRQVVFKQALALLAAEEKTRESEERHRLVVEQTGQLVYDFDVGSQNVTLSGAISRITGYEPDEVRFDRSFWKEHIHPEDREPVFNFLTNVIKNKLTHYLIYYRFLRKDGRYIYVEDNGVALGDASGRTYRVLATMKDVTYQRQAEQNQKLAIDVLQILNRSNDFGNIIKDMLKVFKEYTGIEAIAMRLRKGEDFPYYVENGFSPDFIERERHLCVPGEGGDIARDAEGSPYLACMCGNVLSGRTDPSYPFFTEGGSFWTNSLSKLPASAPEEGFQRPTRNVCIEEGYESVALIPLKSNGKVVGLLQLNDRRRDQFIAKFIQYLEGIGSSIGVALRRLQSEESLKEREERFSKLFENMGNAVAVYEAGDEGRDFILRDFNAAAEKTEKISRDRIIGRPVSEVFPGVKDMGLFEVFQRVYRTGKPEKCPVTLYKDQRISGWRENYVYKLPSGEIVTIYDDATARKEAEKAIEVSEKKYHGIFENAVEGIFRSAPEGRFVSVNPAMAKIHGFISAEEMAAAITDIGRQLYVNPDDRKKYREILEAKGVVEGFEAQVYRKDRSVIWTSTNARAGKDDTGSIIYFEGTVEDITLRKKAEEELKDTLQKLRATLGATVQAMAIIVETRDPYTAGHQKRVASLARAVAQEMGLSRNTVDGIRVAGLIHDIGKISVPAEILSKPTKLTDIEFNIIKVHSEAGYNILKDIDFPWPVADIVLQHHEKLDGSGYPKGLKDKEILIEAKILIVADVVEAMASHRPYRPAQGIEVALEEIEKNKGILYDSETVEACLSLFREKQFSFS